MHAVGLTFQLIVNTPLDLINLPCFQHACVLITFVGVGCCMRLMV